MLENIIIRPASYVFYILVLIILFSCLLIRQGYNVKQFYVTKCITLLNKFIIIIVMDYLAD